MSTEQSRWIDCTERLPKDDTMVIVAIAPTQHNKVGKTLVTTSYFGDGLQFWDMDLKRPAENQFWRVTHWMPFPEFPA